MQPLKIGMSINIIMLLSGCFLFSSKGELLYEKGRYSIRKKNLVSYYQASPDLFVKNDEQEIRINLNAFGKRLIAQEKIDSISITNITIDSLAVYFSTKDTTRPVTEECITFNITKVIDSIKHNRITQR